MTADPQRPDTGRGEERRRHPRFLAGGRLVGTLVVNDRPVRIRDVSQGGFSTETVEPVATGLTGPVRIIASDDWSAVLDATSLYCRPSVSQTGMPMFVTGFAFIDRAEARPAIATLLEKVTSVAFGDES